MEWDAERERDDGSGEPGRHLDVGAVLQVLEESNKVGVVPHHAIEQLEVALEQREEVFPQLRAAWFGVTPRWADVLRGTV